MNMTVLATAAGASARQALRDALNNHPDRQTILKGRSASVLTMNELRDAVAQLNITAAVALPITPDSVATDMNTADTADTAGTADTTDAAIEQELQTVRQLIVGGGFSALDTRLRELVREARKPAVVIERTVTVEVEVPATPAGQPPRVAQARQTSATASWKKLFGVKGTLASETAHLWDGTHPDTPEVNARYRWPHPETATVLVQIKRNRNVMLYGPAGTGKTEFASQLAAQLQRPFSLISCDSNTDAATLLGMTVPTSDGNVAWQDGQLTKAIQQAGCVICLDEPSVARPGALFVFQNVLANRVLYLGETGRRVRVAPGVIFIATDNTNGMGGGAKLGYTDTNRLNAAFLDRFGVRVRFNYMDAAAEAKTVCDYTGCTLALAELLVSAATTTRAAADNQGITHGIGLRRLFSWAELLTDGIDAETAFHAAILNAAPENDREAIRQACLLAYDRQTVAAALAPPGTPVPSAAATDFPDDLDSLNDPNNTNETEG